MQRAGSTPRQAVYINASNHANEADAVQTVLHEAVAHYGLRALFGKDFDTMLDKFYRAADSNIHKGNPLNEDGTLKVEKINAIDELTDEDFSNPTRNVQLPAIPQKVAIKLDDKSPIVVLDVNENKDFTEIVGWYTLDERNLGRVKRQAIKNGGDLVMLSLKDKVESLSTPNDDLSTHKDIPSAPNSQARRS